jgi:hypothetical protein
MSGGGPSALAAAAAMPDRVTRCATIVGIGPHDAGDLDFLAGMSDEERAEWACARQGQECLADRFYRDAVEWAQSLAASGEVPEPWRGVLSQAMWEGLRTPWGMVDDYASLLASWGSTSPTSGARPG